MKFNPIEDSVEDNQFLTQEYTSATETGPFRLGESCLFYRKLFKIYYIPYKCLARAYRRVTSYQAKMCCASGEIKEESFVLHNSKDVEVAMVPVPNEKVGVLMLKKLAEYSPSTILSCPIKSDQENETEKIEGV